MEKHNAYSACLSTLNENPSGKSTLIGKSLSCYRISGIGYRILFHKTSIVLSTEGRWNRGSELVLSPYMNLEIKKESRSFWSRWDRRKKMSHIKANVTLCFSCARWEKKIVSTTAWECRLTFPRTRSANAWTFNNDQREQRD